MRLVVVESPFAGSKAEVERNLDYVRAAMADCLKRGEAPYASHALYTQPGVLDDKVPAERKLGMKAGFAWGGVAQLTVVYVDCGISRGMAQGILNAHAAGRPVELRSLVRQSDDPLFDDLVRGALARLKDSLAEKVLAVLNGRNGAKRKRRAPSEISY